MNLKEIARILPRYFDAGIAVEITGPSGIGKSEVIEQLAKELSKRDGFEWGLGRHFFATYTPPDVTGYLSMYENEVVLADGTKRTLPVSHFSQPPWMLDDNGRPLNSFKRGIMVLEEYDKAIPEVKKASGPIILSGGVAEWRLHKGIARVILSNDESSTRQGSTKDFDFLINRKVILRASTSVQSWIEWADAHDIHPMFKAFAEEHTDVVFSGKVPEKQGPFCSPRSLVTLANLSAKGFLDPDGSLIEKETEAFAESAMGAIGAVATKDLMTWFQMRDDVPKWSEIVAKPKSAKVPEKASGQLMVAHTCAYNVDAKTIDQAISYVRRLKPSFHLTFVKSMARRNFNLVNTKAYDKWAEDEPSLTALMNALGGAR